MVTLDLIRDMDGLGQGAKQQWRRFEDRDVNARDTESVSVKT